jgi:hypothetical protein
MCRRSRAAPAIRPRWFRRNTALSSRPYATEQHVEMVSPGYSYYAPVQPRCGSCGYGGYAGYGTGGYGY